MSNTKTEAQRLADRTTPYHGPHAQAMARELRRLDAENQQLKTSLALVQQHHATAWNRGHQAGIRAGESAVKQATDAVKADAWGNTQLTNALMQAEAERDQLRAQLAKAVASKCELLEALEHYLIQDEIAEGYGGGVGGSAREQARAAIAKATGEHHDN